MGIVTHTTGLQKVRKRSLVVHFREPNSILPICSRATMSSNQRFLSNPSVAGLLTCPDCIKLFDDSYMAVAFGTRDEQRKRGVTENNMKRSFDQGIF